MLHFWATWCGPCMAEMPKVSELRERYADNNEIRIVGVNLDDDPEQARRAIAARELGEPQLLMGPWKDNDLCRLYGVTALPSYWLIGPDGRVVVANGTLAELTSALDRAVEPPPAAGAKTMNSSRLNLTALADKSPVAPGENSD